MATLAPNLDRARHSIWARWPGAVVGWIGDTAHMADCSDHNEDGCGLVHAIDVMFNAGTPEANAVVRAMVGRPDMEYVIHNRTIWSRNTSWQPHAYTGPDPHTNHVHGSGKHGASCVNSHTCNGYDKNAENDATAWSFGGSPMADADIPDTHRLSSNSDNFSRAALTGEHPVPYLGGSGAGVPSKMPTNALHDKLDTILANTIADLAEDKAATAALKALAGLIQTGGGNLDIAPVLAAVAEAREAVRQQVVDLTGRLSRAATAEAQALGSST